MLMNRLAIRFVCLFVCVGNGQATITKGALAIETNYPLVTDKAISEVSTSVVHSPGID